MLLNHVVHYLANVCYLSKVLNIFADHTNSNTSLYSSALVDGPNFEDRIGIIPLPTIISRE